MSQGNLCQRFEQREKSGVYPKSPNPVNHAFIKPQHAIPTFFSVEITEIPEKLVTSQTPVAFAYRLDDGGKSEVEAMSKQALQLGLHQNEKGQSPSTSVSTSSVAARKSNLKTPSSSNTTNVHQKTQRKPGVNPQSKIQGFLSPTSPQQNQGKVKQPKPNPLNQEHRYSAAKLPVLVPSSDFKARKHPMSKAEPSKPKKSISPRPPNMKISNKAFIVAAAKALSTANKEHPAKAKEPTSSTKPYPNPKNSKETLATPNTNKHPDKIPSAKKPSITKPFPKKPPPNEIECIPAPGLPEGWIRKTFKRLNGVTKGGTDKYWFSPKTNKKFRSMKQVGLFLDALKKYDGDEDMAAWNLK